MKVFVGLGIFVSGSEDRAVLCHAFGSNELVREKPRSMGGFTQGECIK